MNNISSVKTTQLLPTYHQNEKKVDNGNQLPKDMISISGNSGSQEHVPGELLIKFKGKAPKELTFRNGAEMEVVKKFDLPAKDRNDSSELCKVKLNGVTVEEGLQLLKNNDQIAYAEPNYIIQVPDNPQSPVETQAAELPKNAPNDLKPELWGLHNTGQNHGTPDADIDAPEAWGITVGKKEGGPLIAVIDTGVDYNHPDLVNNIWTNTGEIPGDGIDNDGNGYVDDVHGYNFAYNNGDPMDDHSHGTHCSGTIGAEGDNGIGITGVAWNAQIMAVKFLGKNGGTTENAIESVIYATKAGADICSNSWGGGPYSNALADAISSYPGLFVAAAGNSSSNNDVSPHYPSSYDSPNVLSVASTDSNDHLSYFSCYGEKSVDIAAPGSNIYSTIPGGGYAYKSGTSMATPHVAGVAALIMSQFPDLTAIEVKDAILKGGDDVAALHGKVTTGKRLNAYGALKAAEEIHNKKA